MTTASMVILRRAARKRALHLRRIHVVDEYTPVIEYCERRGIDFVPQFVGQHNQFEDWQIGHKAVRS